MNAAIPPRRCASAMTCWQTVVLPDDSGPKISVIRPRGMTHTPRARSSAMEPVGMDPPCVALVRRRQGSVTPDRSGDGATADQDRPVAGSALVGLLFVLDRLRLAGLSDDLDLHRRLRPRLHLGQ